MSNVLCWGATKSKGERAHCLLLPLSQVFEVFGPVSTPYYVLRFNSEEEIVTKGLVVGCTVFYTPEHKEYTGYVLTKHLQK